MTLVVNSELLRDLELLRGFDNVDLEELSLDNVYSVTLVDKESLSFRNDFVSISKFFRASRKCNLLIA